MSSMGEAMAAEVYHQRLRRHVGPNDSGDVRPSGGRSNHAQHSGHDGQLVHAPTVALPLNDEGGGRSDHFNSPG
jgi:hypothetical protein